MVPVDCVLEDYVSNRQCAADTNFHRLRGFCAPERKFIEAGEKACILGRLPSLLLLFMSTSSQPLLF